MISITDLFKESWNTFISKIKDFALLILISFVLTFALAGITGTLFVLFNRNILLFSFLLLVLAITFAFLISWMQAAFIYIIKDAITLKSAIEKAKDKAFPFFWVSVLTGLITALGLILLVVPGIIFACWFAFSAFIVINENLNGMAALKRSKELVKGNTMQVFFRLLLIFLIMAVVNGLLNKAELVNAIVTNFVITPFSVIYGYKMYEDLLKRKTA